MISHSTRQHMESINPQFEHFVVRHERVGTVLEQPEAPTVVRPGRDGVGVVDAGPVAEGDGHAAALQSLQSGCPDHSSHSTLRFATEQVAFCYKGACQPPSGGLGSSKMQLTRAAGERDEMTETIQPAGAAGTVRGPLVDSRYPSLRTEALGQLKPACSPTWTGCSSR